MSWSRIVEKDVQTTKIINQLNEGGLEIPVSLGVTEVDVVVGAILRAGCGSLSAPSSDVLPLHRSVSQRQAVARDEDESEMSSMSHFVFTPSGRLTFPRTIERLIHSLTIPVFDLNLQNCHYILCTRTLESLVGL